MEPEVLLSSPPSLALSKDGQEDQRKIVKADLFQDDDVNSMWIAPPGTLIEGFASWQLSKKALSEKQQQRGKTARITQGFGAALKATALLTQPQGGNPGVYVHSAADALRSGLAGMEQTPTPSLSGPPSPSFAGGEHPYSSAVMRYGDTFKGGVEAVADLLMSNAQAGSGLGNKNNLQNNATMMIVSRALDDLAYLQNKKRESLSST